MSQSERSALAQTLLTAPTRDQGALLELVARVQVQPPYLGPTFYWIEDTLDQWGIDAAEVLGTFPTIQVRVPGPAVVHYGAAWFTPHTVPAPESEVRLTVLGLALSSAGEHLAGMTISLIRALSLLRMRVGGISPRSASDPEVTSDDVLQVSLPPPGSGWEEPMLRPEPPTWRAVLRRPEDQRGWTITLPRTLRRFDDMDGTIEDYVDRLVSVFAIPPTQPPRMDSAFSLPAAIDYFDAIWRLSFGEPVIVLPGAERVAKLVVAVSSPEEFDSRLSALAEVLKIMRVPGSRGVGGRGLERLPIYLKARLPPEAHESVDLAIARMDAARRVRIGGQHSGRTDTVDALRELGVTYPIIDYRAAWAQISSVVAGSFNSLREEIQAAGLSSR